MTEDLALVLKDVQAYLSRYVVFTTAHQEIATTLWVATTWAIAAFDVAPYLLITAPERQSGKTRLLEVLEAVVHKPLLAAGISPAALYRVVERQSPTLLLDEIDAIYGPKAAGNEELRALINSGHRRGVKTYRMGGGGMTRLESFDSFCLKALAGIESGRHLPETVVDRSIPIRLRRRAPTEEVVRYRRRVAAAEGAILAAKLNYLLGGITELEWPEMPAGISDRATDVWEPLIAIADLAGEEWSEMGRAAAFEIAANPDPTYDSLGVRLLSDIRTVMGGTDRMSSTDLARALAELDEAPWGDLYGRAISVRKLADLLRPFGITSRNVRVGGAQAKGYTIADFIESWKRYLPGVADVDLPPYEVSLFDGADEPPEEEFTEPEASPW